MVEDVLFSMSHLGLSTDAPASDAIVDAADTLRTTHHLSIGRTAWYTSFCLSPTPWVLDAARLPLVSDSWFVDFDPCRRYKPGSFFSFSSALPLHMLRWATGSPSDSSMPSAAACWVLNTQSPIGSAGLALTAGFSKPQGFQLLFHLFL